MGRGNCCERIDHDQTGSALHDSHVGVRETADLIDAIGDLEQAVNGVELGLTPEAWIDRGRRVVLQEFIGIGAGRRRDETLVGIFEVLAVAERQLRQNGTVGTYNRWFSGHRLLGAPLIDQPDIQDRDQPNDVRKSGYPVPML